MKGTYATEAFKISNPYEGKNTGTKSKTEQEYIPLAVQIKRMINAGEALVTAKKEMYDIGWDEDFNINRVKPHAINMDMDRIEMQEVLENATEQINASREPESTENEPESTGSTDIPTEETESESEPETE